MATIRTRLSINGTYTYQIYNEAGAQVLTESRPIANTDDVFLDFNAPTDGKPHFFVLHVIRPDADTLKHPFLFAQGTQVDDFAILEGTEEACLAGQQRMNMSIGTTVGNIGMITYRVYSMATGAKIAEEVGKPYPYSIPLPSVYTGAFFVTATANRNTGSTADDLYGARLLNLSGCNVLTTTVPGGTQTTVTQPTITIDPNSCYAYRIHNDTATVKVVLYTSCDGVALSEPIDPGDTFEVCAKAGQVSTELEVLTLSTNCAPATTVPTTTENEYLTIESTTNTYWEGDNQFLRVFLSFSSGIPPFDIELSNSTTGAQLAAVSGVNYPGSAGYTIQIPVPFVGNAVLRVRGRKGDENPNNDQITSRAMTLTGQPTTTQVTSTNPPTTSATQPTTSQTPTTTANGTQVAEAISLEYVSDTFYTKLRMKAPVGTTVRAHRQNGANRSGDGWTQDTFKATIEQASGIYNLVVDLNPPNFGVAGIDPGVWLFDLNYAGTVEVIQWTVGPTGTFVIKGPTPTTSAGTSTTVANFVDAAQFLWSPAGKWGQVRCKVPTGTKVRISRQDNAARSGDDWNSTSWYDLQTDTDNPTLYNFRRSFNAYSQGLGVDAGAWWIDFESGGNIQRFGVTLSGAYGIRYLKVPATSTTAPPTTTAPTSTTPTSTQPNVVQTAQIFWEEGTYRVEVRAKGSVGTRLRMRRKDGAARSGNGWSETLYRNFFEETAGIFNLKVEMQPSTFGVAGVDPGVWLFDFELNGTVETRELTIGAPTGNKTIKALATTVPTTSGGTSSTTPSPSNTTQEAARTNTWDGDLARLRLRQSIALVAGPKGPGHSTYLAGPSAGYKSYIHDPTYNDTRDYITMYGDYADTLNMFACVSPIYTWDNWFSKGRVRYDRAAALNMANRVQQVGGWMLPFLALVGDFRNNNAYDTLYWDIDYNMRRSDNPGLYATDGSQVSAALEMMDDTATPNSPYFLFRDFLYDIVDFHLPYIQSKLVGGFNIIPGATTHEIRYDIDNNDASAAGWVADHGPYAQKGFRQWLATTFNNSINDFKGWITQGGEFNNVTTINGIALSSISSFSQVYLTRGFGSATCSWLDVLSYVYKHLRMKRHMQICYGLIRNRMSYHSVPASYADNMLRIYDYGQPLGAQTVNTNVVMWPDMAATGNMLQTNPGPQDETKFWCDLFVPQGKGTWMETDGDFTNRLIIQEAANNGQMTLKKQMVDYWSNGGVIWGQRNCFDNTLSETKEPYITSVVGQIAYDFGQGNNTVNGMVKTPNYTQAISYSAKGALKNRGFHGSVKSEWNTKSPGSHTVRVLIMPNSDVLSLYTFPTPVYVP